MLRRYAGVFLLLFIATAANADQVDDLMLRQLDRNHIPGAAVAVVKDGKIIKLAGYGVANLDWDLPVETNTKFQIVSSTKPFTGLLLMTLVADGKINLDDSVCNYLQQAPESWRKITVRMLATHSSGLKFDLGDQKFKSIDEAVAEASRLPLDYEPGTQSHYALTDFVVLTKVLETAGGKPYQQLLQERVLQPLGLRQTQFDYMNDEGAVRGWQPLKWRSTTYRWTGHSQQAYAFFYPAWTYSAGGLFSTAEDMAQFLIGLSSGKFLDPALLEEMWTPMVLKSGTRGNFALGWTVHQYRGLRVVGHSGGPALSDIAYFPEQKLGVVVLTNQQHNFPLLAETVANFYLPADAHANDRVLEDPDPKRTESLRGFIAALTEGKVDPTLFSAEANKELLPMIREYGPVIVNQLDPLSKMDLIDRQVTGTGMRLVYRVYFGDRPMTWRFVLDRESKITDLDPSSAD